MKKSFETPTGSHTFEIKRRYFSSITRSEMLLIEENHPRHGRREFACTPRQFEAIGE